MKKISFILLLVFLCACARVNKIGEFNVISTRNFSTKENYILLKSYAGGTMRDLRKSRATTIDQAVDRTVKSVPGGEFMQNVKVYMVRHGKKIYFAVEGDVWGRDTLR